MSNSRIPNKEETMDKMEAGIPTIVIKQESDSHFYCEDGPTHVKHDEEEFISDDGLSNPAGSIEEKTEEAEPAFSHQDPMVDKMIKKTDDRELLIELVRNEPRLWDLRNKSYHNQDIKNELWESIGKQLNLKDVEVKSKWQILRSNYMREKRKQKTTALGTEVERCKVAWPFFPMLSFLDNSLRMRKKIRSNPVGSDDFATSSHCKFENLDEGVHSCATEDTNSHSDSDSQEQFLTSNSKEKTMKENSLDGDEIDNRYLKQIVKLSSTALDNNDPDILFFKSLLPEIKQLDSNENLRFKIEVAQLLLSKLQPNIHNLSTG